MAGAYIISSVRTAVCKAPKGAFRATRPDDLAAVALTAALERAQVEAGVVEDVILGCAMPEAEQGLNVARISALRAGIPVEASAATVNRFCASGLEAVAIGCERVASGAQAVLAGGAESMSMVPIVGNKPSANPWLMEHRPGSYLSMGLTAERVAREHKISREAADDFALQSHRKAAAAQAEGRFEEEIAPVATRVPDAEAEGYWRDTVVTRDEGPRADTNPAALAALKPAFRAHGTVTAGNSSQMSDGAAAALIASESLVRELHLRPLARLAGYATAGVAPEMMGMGPVAAIPRALKRAGVGLKDIEVIELNEAFACQALAVIAALDLDPERVNVNGGAIALGHPLGCTGAKLLATLLSELRRRRKRWGLISLCVGGGQGAAAVVENLVL
ncbi:MAG TPA: acetyl-CoA C-acyltransferase [Terriglobales bacterium]|nr:acetyl-CoA C-acyltransferase [Terriglobales bacterium]